MKQITVNEDIKTIGLDLGDTKSTLCVMDAAGAIESERTITTTREALTQKFGR